jgi:hypothetical protein
LGRRAAPAHLIFRRAHTLWACRYQAPHNTNKSVILLKHTKKSPSDAYVMVSFLETQKEKINKHAYEPVSKMEFLKKKWMIFGSKTPIFPVFK